MTDPASGQVIRVVIPAGTKPGDILSVNVPSAAAVAVSVADDTADADEMVRVEKTHTSFGGLFIVVFGW